MSKTPSTYPRILIRSAVEVLPVAFPAWLAQSQLLGLFALLLYVIHTGAACRLLYWTRELERQKLRRIHLKAENAWLEEEMERHRYRVTTWDLFNATDPDRNKE